LGISQQKLSENLGFSLAMIKSMECNRKKPSIETLLKMSDYFGVTTDYILKGPA
jgi:transcriptional regulator with XRE-family HTH domain